MLAISMPPVQGIEIFDLDMRAPATRTAYYCPPAGQLATSSRRIASDRRHTHRVARPAD